MRGYSRQPGPSGGMEATGELATNFASLGYDLKALVAQKKLALKVVHIERGEIEEVGEYPFLIDAGGISIWPITTMGLERPADTKRVSSWWSLGCAASRSVL